MILVNEKVEHISFGVGVVTEERDNKISVQFQEKIGSKIFVYPDAFERFLKALNKTVENNVLDELRKRQEQLEFQRLEEDLKALGLKEKILKEAPKKRRTTKGKA